jgi:uracil-DNA glycosylase
MLREAGRLPARGAALPFGHGVAHDLGGGVRLFGSYHPSQQNTFTGRLTAASFDAVLADVRRHLGTEAA